MLGKFWKTSQKIRMLLFARPLYYLTLQRNFFMCYQLPRPDDTHNIIVSWSALPSTRMLSKLTSKCWNFCNNSNCFPPLFSLILLTVFLKKWPQKPRIFSNMTISFFVAFQSQETCSKWPFPNLSSQPDYMNSRKNCAQISMENKNSFKRFRR